MVQNIDYFYDSQIRTIILHTGRIFMNWQISIGKDPTTGEDILKRVPCRFINGDRQVAHIMNQVSENVILPAPFITYHIEDIDIARDRTQAAWESNDELIRERYYSDEKGNYTEEQGTDYHVVRMPPVPIDITFKVNIWTTKITHKFQLLEQIRTIFNPSVDLQTSTNIVDWTNITAIEMTELNWSTRSVPYGTEDQMDIMEMEFMVQTWINPPGTVTRSKVINTIIANIGDGACVDDIFGWSFPDDITRSIYTPKNYYIKVNGNIITLLDGFGNTTQDTWQSVFDLYGRYEPDVTQIRVRAMTLDVEDDSHDVYGTVRIDEQDPTKLIWNIDIDTLPKTTLEPVNEIINPHEKFPGHGLPAVEGHQRYLLVDSLDETQRAKDKRQINYEKEMLGSPTVAWGDVRANKWDIIEYDATESKWIRVFNSQEDVGTQIVASLASGKRYEWDKEHGWIDPINGVWRSGWWRLALSEGN